MPQRMKVAQWLTLAVADVEWATALFKYKTCESMTAGQTALRVTETPSSVLSN